jgi:hypothetical protein
MKAIQELFVGRDPINKERYGRFSEWISDFDEGFLIMTRGFDLRGIATLDVAWSQVINLGACMDAEGSAHEDFKHDGGYEQYLLRQWRQFMRLCRWRLQLQFRSAYLWDIKFIDGFMLFYGAMDEAPFVVFERQGQGFLFTELTDEWKILFLRGCMPKVKT